MSETDRDIAQLLDLAGIRPRLPAERAHRIRAAALPAWQEEVRSYRWSRMRSGAVWALAAGLLLAAGLALWNRSTSAFGREIAVVERIVDAAPRLELRDGASRSLAEGGSVRAGRRITTGEGRVALGLAGGTSLRIDVGTSIEALSDRLFELASGAVYVDARGVAPDRAITVRTPFGTVREIGTQFEVRVEEEALRVRVREGRVVVASPTGSIEAEAHAELRLRGDGTLERGTVLAHGPEWDWVLEVVPAFALDRSSLGEFLGWLERETGWSVRYADPPSRAALDAISIRGPRATVSPREALPMVLAASELSYRLEGGVVTIFKNQETGGSE